MEVYLINNSWVFKQEPFRKKIARKGTSFWQLNVKLENRLQAAAKSDEQTQLWCKKGDIQVNDGMNCWTNWLTSPCTLINLVLRNRVAVKAALGYLHRCTHRCSGAASLGPAHSPSSCSFTRCSCRPACWLRIRLLPAHTNAWAERVLARLRTQQND